MMMSGKVAIVHAATGAIGSAIARAFAKEGARLFLTGRSAGELEALGLELGARVDVIDVRDPAAVTSHAAQVDEQADGIDIVVNAMNCDPVQGIALDQIELADFRAPFDDWLVSQFLTATAAARHMRVRERGVIITISASPARKAIAGTAGFGVACAAVEALTRTLAAELGPSGIRVAGVRPQRIWETVNGDADLPMSREEFKRLLEDMTLTKRLPTLDQVAAAVVYLASDRGGATIDLSCGMDVA